MASNYKHIYRFMPDVKRTDNRVDRVMNNYLWFHACTGKAVLMSQTSKEIIHSGV